MKPLFDGSEKSSCTTKNNMECIFLTFLSFFSTQNLPKKSVSGCPRSQKKNKPSPILCYSVIISEIIIILFIVGLLPNISSLVIKLLIIIITDYTITDHTITDWSYYFSVLIPKIPLLILTFTFCSDPELCYYR